MHDMTELRQTSNTVTVHSTAGNQRLLVGAAAIYFFSMFIFQIAEWESYRPLSFRDYAWFAMLSFLTNFGLLQSMTALWPPSLRDEACEEVYQYIDHNIRKLPRKPDRSFDSVNAEFHRNDVDALRHAYVSGVFTQEYGETIADIFGRANELVAYGSRSRGSDADINMDLWNNSVGRRYGTKTREL